MAAGNSQGHKLPHAHPAKERAPFLTPFLKAVSFILLVLMDAGLPIPERATVEEDGIGYDWLRESTPGVDFNSPE